MLSRSYFTYFCAPIHRSHTSSVGEVGNLLDSSSIWIKYKLLHYRPACSRNDATVVVVVNTHRVATVTMVGRKIHCEIKSRPPDGKKGAGLQVTSSGKDEPIAAEDDRVCSCT